MNWNLLLPPIRLNEQVATYSGGGIDGLINFGVSD